MPDPNNECDKPAGQLITDSFNPTDCSTPGQRVLYYTEGNVRQVITNRFGTDQHEVIWIMQRPIKMLEPGHFNNNLNEPVLDVHPPDDCSATPRMLHDDKSVNIWTDEANIVNFLWPDMLASDDEEIESFDIVSEEAKDTNDDTASFRAVTDPISPGESFLYFLRCPEITVDQTKKIPLYYMSSKDGDGVWTLCPIKFAKFPKVTWDATTRRIHLAYWTNEQRIEAQSYSVDPGRVLPVPSGPRNYEIIGNTKRDKNGNVEYDLRAVDINSKPIPNPASGGVNPPITGKTPGVNPSQPPLPLNKVVIGYKGGQEAPNEVSIPHQTTNTYHVVGRDPTTGGLLTVPSGYDQVTGTLTDLAICSAQLAFPTDDRPYWDKECQKGIITYDPNGKAIYNPTSTTITKDCMKQDYRTGTITPSGPVDRTNLKVDATSYTFIFLPTPKAAQNGTPLVSTLSLCVSKKVSSAGNGEIELLTYRTNEQPGIGLSIPPYEDILKLVAVSNTVKIDPSLRVKDLKEGQPIPKLIEIGKTLLTNREACVLILRAKGFDPGDYIQFGSDCVEFCYHTDSIATETPKPPYDNTYKLPYYNVINTYFTSASASNPLSPSGPYEQFGTPASILSYYNAGVTLINTGFYTTSTGTTLTLNDALSSAGVTILQAQTTVNGLRAFYEQFGYRNSGDLNFTVGGVGCNKISYIATPPATPASAWATTVASVPSGPISVGLGSFMCVAGGYTSVHINRKAYNFNSTVPNQGPWNGKVAVYGVFKLSGIYDGTNRIDGVNIADPFYIDIRTQEPHDGNTGTGWEAGQLVVGDTGPFYNGTNTYSINALINPGFTIPSIAGGFQARIKDDETFPGGTTWGTGKVISNSPSPYFDFSLSFVYDLVPDSMFPSPNFNTIGQTYTSIEPPPVIT